MAVDWMKRAENVAWPVQVTQLTWVNVSALSTIHRFLSSLKLSKYYIELI